MVAVGPESSHDMSEIESKIESPAAARRRLEEAGRTSDETYRFGHPPSLPKWKPAPATRSAAPSDLEIEVIDLKNNRDRGRFVDMPLPLYKGDPNYIAPLRLDIMKFLNPSKSPIFRDTEMRAIIAHQGGRPVGRLTCQVDSNYNAYHETKSGWFGYFESIDDPAVAHGMLEDGLSWLKERGMVDVFGPANPTMSYQSGLLVENFERPPFIENLYNPRYYESLFTSFGFGKAKDLLVWWIDVSNGMDSPKRQRVQRIADRIKKREGITVRNASIAQADREIEHLYELYMACWQKNWGFAPFSREAFVELAQDLKQIIVEELLLFVMVGDRVVGFCLTLPNMNEKFPKNGRLFPFGWTKLLFNRTKTKHARLYLLGMLPEYRKRGLEAIMFSETTLRGQRLGYQAGEIGWTLEDNDLINRAIESMEGYVDRRYRVFGLDLTD